MALLVANGIEKTFGDRHILKGCDLRIDPRDRVGLVGVNGSGKSTLMRILGGQLDSDSGEIHKSGTQAILDQEPEFDQGTVGEIVASAVAWHRELLTGYEAALEAGDLNLSSTLQDQLDLRGWEIDHKIDAVLDRVCAPPKSASVRTLSGGEKRRVALASVLLQAPDLLFLDEPTNHLDADTIEWLQGYLAGYRGAVVLVTHDRYLLETVADRVIEVDQGLTVAYEGSYGDYLIQHAERQAERAQTRAKTLGFIAREAAWAVRSPSARSTKQKARLQRLEALRESVPAARQQKVRFNFKTGVRKGSILLELHGISKSFGDNHLIDNLDLSLLPRERIGIVGPNGAGKTTLLRIIQQVLEPDTGEILIANRAKFGLLDQERTGLNPEHSLFEAAGDGNDQVKVGQEWIHVASFLNRFSFTRETFDQKVAGLSGGEKARLLLAKLMLQGASLLLLDEPTNDLDLLTLRVLEEALMGFDGTAIIVTHDRAFLDRVCTAVLAFEGDGQVTRYASRRQWLRALDERRKSGAPAKKAAPKPRKIARVGLSFKEKKELEAIPAKIEALEHEVESLQGRLSDPAIYRDETVDIAALNRDLGGLQERVEGLYERWEKLGELAG